MALDLVFCQCNLVDAACPGLSTGDDLRCDFCRPALCNYSVFMWGQLEHAVRTPASKSTEQVSWLL